MESTDRQEIERFIRDLENALNSHNAGEYNRYFDSDISWVNPNGEILRGFEPLHAVHDDFLKGALKNSILRYAIERLETLSSDSAFVHCRLTRTNADGSTVESDERCLYVLVRKEGAWWLCAGHNTRIQPPEPD